MKDKSPASVPILSVRHIYKGFSGVQALADVDFDVERGSVHALCGENGAGKSTLMKCINGLYKADSGEIHVNGKEVHIKNPLEARELGIAMIPQELNFVPDMSIAEFFFLGRLPKKGMWIDWRYINAEARKILAEEGLAYAPSKKLKELTIAEIQILEIARSVYHNADVIIMDEPTSAIAEKEVAALFQKIAHLKENGKSVIYISHKMDEVFTISDHITILRDGSVVSTQPAEDIDLDTVISQMVGREIDRNAYPKSHIPSDELLLEVEDLCSDRLFKDVSLKVHKGEVVGLAGLVGAGRTEVLEAIFGMAGTSSGTIKVHGKEFTAMTPKKSIGNNIGLLTEDRRLQGIVPKMSLRENTTLAKLKQFIYGGLARIKKEREVTSRLFTAMNVKAPHMDVEIDTLSGGNQQKVLLARWLAADSQLLLLDEPTRGIDVAAKFEIYSIIDNLAAEGRGILVVSSELPELIGLCDRIYVMAAGRVQAELHADDGFDQETILSYAMNRGK